ncbi:hypothetical protein SprV_0802564400 [Sparganum proliferum]
MDNFPPEEQHILALAFGVLSATQLTPTADPLTKIHGFSKPSISALPTPSTPPASLLSQWEIGLTELADDMASLQKQTASPSSRSQPKPSTPHVQSAHPARPNIAVTCWFHNTFGAKERRCICLCSFTSKQSKQLSDIPPKPADRRCRNLGIFLQAVNTSPISTFGTCSLSLDIDLRPLFPWAFVITDISCAILGADFLSAFDILVDCRQSRLHDKTTNFTVRDDLANLTKCSRGSYQPPAPSPAIHADTVPGSAQVISESYLEKELATCSYVYLRCDRVRRHLKPPYDGPFRVISRGKKNFRIQR